MKREEREEAGLDLREKRDRRQRKEVLKKVLEEILKKHLTNATESDIIEKLTHEE